jgi:protein required for attachment to host cells
MNTVWVLVCDAARGRLFEIRENDPSWHVIETFSHPESRSKAAELVTDHMGHNSSEGGSVHHNALAPTSSPKEVEKGHFGHTLAALLDQAMRSRRFHRWVLIAPAHFLGMLKNELTVELTKHLMASVDKDLTNLDLHQLAERLRDVVCIPPDQREALRQADKHGHRGAIQ